jgi:hypothetical protein
MSDNETVKNEIIRVEQLPIIREKLSEVSAAAQEKIKDALSLIVSEETVKTVKTVRADLNKQFAELEGLRKQVKNAILAPYEEFEAIYRELISNHFTTADAALKGRILEVEDALVKEKEEDIRAYFEELRVRENLDWVKFEDANIKVNLSASAKGLRDACDNYIKGIVQDINLIRETNAELAPEMLVEYKKVRNPLIAIRVVLNRKEELEQVTATEQVRTVQQEQETVRQAQMMEFLPPAQAQQVKEEKREPEKIYTAAFKARGTKEQLQRLATFMRASGIEFETIKPEQKPPQAQEPKEELEAEGETVVFVQFKKEDGTYGGRKYTYLVPPEYAQDVGEGVEVILPEKNGESPKAVVVGVGTTNDVSESIRGILKAIKGVI